MTVAYSWKINGNTVAQPEMDPFDNELREQSITTAITLDSGDHTITVEGLSSGGDFYDIEIVVIVGDNTEDNCVVFSEPE